jgi:threonine aldolase
VRTLIDSPGEHYYGVDIADDGALVIAERMNGKCSVASRYPAGETGVSALREHIAHDHSRSHVCIRACGAAALATATGLIALPRVEVTLVTPHAIESQLRAGRDSAFASPEERAQRLARLAERLF